jgi:type II secretory ATPase GspE/PulE/Tfp pilus assembly ATPase PilB-like protein
VKAVSIGPALSLVIAQRLVRVLCPHCKKAVVVDAAMQAKIAKFLDGLPAKVDKTQYVAAAGGAGYTIYEPVGCDQCNNMGYKGRIGIFEFLSGGPDVEATILKEASEIALREVAKRQEMVTMQEDGILKVLLGQTTLAEVEGATGEISW